MVELRRDYSEVLPTKKLKYQKVTIFREKELGRGSYGRIYRASCDELLCAAKQLNSTLFQFSAENSAERRFKQMCDLLFSVKHPCIVQYLDGYICPDTRQAILLMELMDESLMSFLDRSQLSLPIHVQINISLDVIQALTYLHSNDIIHRDLTGRNVLISRGTHAKITDFGMMKMADAQVAANPHLKHLEMPDSSAYLPPEAFKHPPSYSHQLDIFSFGVVCLQIVTRQFPHPLVNRLPEVERRKFELNSVEPKHLLLPIILSCLKDRDILRPTASQLCRKITQLQSSPLYEESLQMREEAIQETEEIREKLSEVQKKNSELLSLLENLRIENKQLCQLITKHSESIIGDEKPLGNKIPEEYLEFVDQSLLNVDLENGMDLSSPHPALWYHGSIKRDVACMRLQAMSKPGAYLIRKSESEPGNYVLSFLDKQLRVFNYKISCRNGQYNVSGQSQKWFSSLQALIGYYTRFSTVKQNQHLDVPVAPPEVVPLPF